jgi:membrane protein YqaA with SNARE-associated domain
VQARLLAVHWYESLGIYAASYVMGVVGGFVPIVNAEVYFATMGATLDRATLLPVVIIGTLGQMTAKTAIFFAGRGILRLPVTRDSERMRVVLAKARAWRGPIELFVFVSAVFGIPPFYLVSLVGGTLEISLPRFIALGLTGRLIRFLTIAFGANAALG